MTRPLHSSAAAAETQHHIESRLMAWRHYGVSCRLDTELLGATQQDVRM
jgi:hypothetical protein